MSSSDTAARKCVLRVHSNQDADIFVIDSTLTVADRAIGYLEKELARGLYKVKVNRGGGRTEQLLNLDGDRTLYLYVNAFPAIAPIGPMFESAVASIALHDLTKQAESESTSAALPEGVLFLAHSARSDEARHGLLQGLFLFPWGSSSAGVTVAAKAKTADVEADTWCAAWLPADPGTHVLEYRDGERVSRQVVPVAPGWQTRVFIRRRTLRALESGAKVGLEVSIQMAPPGFPTVYSDHYETIETARSALESERTLFVTNRLVDQLLYDKFDNPVAGITGLHLFLYALERGREDRNKTQSRRQVGLDPTLFSSSDEVIDTVLSNLEKLLQSSDHSGGRADLIALRARAGRLDSSSRVDISEPPMFWASWLILRRLAGVDGPVYIGRELWSQIAYSARFGAYFAWDRREAVLEDYIDDAIRQSGAHKIPGGFPFEREAVAFYVSGSRLPDDIADSLGIPRSVAGELRSPVDASRIHDERRRQCFQYGARTVTIETGELARQAKAAVRVSMGDTVVLVTVCAAKQADPGRSFLPLTVNYLEKTYAAGRIPGGFFKREGRPTEKETLTSRLIDRPIRPLFPEGFHDDVQIVATVISLDPEVDADIPSMIGTSAALALSGLPFDGPIGAARVGYKDGQYMLNPSAKQLLESDLHLVVAGTQASVLMVESAAKGLSEEVMLGSVVFGHQQMQVAINAIRELVKQAGKPRWDWQAPPPNTELDTALSGQALAALTQAYSITIKEDRMALLNEIRVQMITTLAGGEAPKFAKHQVDAALFKLESDIVRRRVLNGEPRIDGRDHKTVRPITIKVGVLPRTHGSALFTRGETQALVVTTLGTGRDAQIIDALEGERRESFMLHYNFPLFSVGETGMMGSPKRREIGYGNLARRAVNAVMPDPTRFPYVIRVVSEILESKGSSSMASVCGASLSLMDAGVPIEAPVAGVAMGLVLEGGRFKVLTDILGDEDHLGDMDFKVAGTAAGVTALQMDIKVEGVTPQIMQVALEQAKDGRLHILCEMNKVISTPREKLSEWAPSIITLKIDPDKIRDVIGKGGAVIRQITEDTGTTVDVENDGTVKIASVSGAAGREAQRRIELITADVEVGRIYEGTVARLMDFGAFVTILPGRDGLVHISQISDERVERVSDKLKEGDVVRVRVLDVDRQGRVRLSMRDDDLKAS